MPEINHKSSDPVATKIAEALVAEKVKPSDLETKILEVLQKRKAERLEAAKPKEPDWATLTEADAYKPDVYIPMYDHDVPDYLNMKLKDQEYMCVWANKDQRRLGALLAEGYELLKPEHVSPEFRVPLRWSSEGTYEYADTICVRVHKRILLAKRRKALEISQKQLKITNRPPRSRFTPESDVELEPGLNLYEVGI